jgi:CRP/FNR family transcriptional regulator
MPGTPRPEELQAVPYLAPLTPREASAFLSHCLVRRYEARACIALEGAPAEAVYVLRSGRARILSTGPDGREQTFRLAGAGDSFGEVPIFDGGPSPATVETLEPSEVLIIPAERLRQLVATNPAVASALLRHLAMRLRSFTELIQHISLQTVQSRLARYLYQLAREEGEARDGGIVVRRELTQQDLASLLGTAREVVARALRSLADDGVVEVRRTEIVVRDLQRLRQLV